MARKTAKPVVREKPEARREPACAPQWLVQAARGTPRAMLCGKETLVVENCGRVVEICPARVQLATSMGVWTVTGANLAICCESADTAVISGRIESIALGEGDARA